MHVYTTGEILADMEAHIKLENQSSAERWQLGLVYLWAAIEHWKMYLGKFSRKPRFDLMEWSRRKCRNMIYPGQPSTKTQLSSFRCRCTHALQCLQLRSTYTQTILGDADGATFSSIAWDR